MQIGTVDRWGELAVALVAFAVVYYFDEDDEPETAPIPTAAGRNEAINVKRALEAQGLTVEFGRAAIRARGGLTPPPQPFTVGDATLYVFFYEGVAEREAESATLDPASLAFITSAGTPVAGAGSASPDLHVASGSNVIAVLAGGSPELAAQVDAAIASLP
jgi:hypothetical protein